jgi:ferredoxin
MPKLTVEGFGIFEVPKGKRLVNAMIDECDVDQLHACGGFGRCTSCRIEFVSGEPTAMTHAEKDVLEARDLSSTPGLRLSCQIACNEDMEIKPISRLEGSGRANAGGRPGDEIAPPPEWC